MPRNTGDKPAKARNSALAGQSHAFDPFVPSEVEGQPPTRSLDFARDERIAS